MSEKIVVVSCLSQGFLYQLCGSLAYLYCQCRNTVIESFFFISSHAPDTLKCLLINNRNKFWLIWPIRSKYYCRGAGNPIWNVALLHFHAWGKNCVVTLPPWYHYWVLLGQSFFFHLSCQVHHYKSTHNNEGDKYCSFHLSEMKVEIVTCCGLT